MQLNRTDLYHVVAEYIFDGNGIIRVPKQLHKILSKDIQGLSAI